MSDIIIVTRHQAAREYLIKHGIVPKNTPSLSVCTEKDIQGKHVYGYLPIHLAAKTKSYTELPVRPPKSLTSRELNLNEFEFYVGTLTTYEVKEIDFDILKKDIHGF